MSKINDQKFMSLYNEHKSDEEISRILHVARSTVGRYRNAKELPKNSKGGRPKGIQNQRTIPFHPHSPHQTFAEMFTLPQQKELRRFLSLIYSCSLDAHELGLKINISAAIEAWRNKPLDEE